MKYYQRLLADKMLSPVSKSKIRLLLGARQTGKSTLLRHILATTDGEVVAIDLQDSARRIAYERRPSLLSEQLLAMDRKKKHVLIDEIQKVPALLDEIQRLYDGYRNRFEFYLTGSSARKLRRGSANLLPGRTHLYMLSPLIQAERAVSSVITPSFPLLDKPHFAERSLESLLLYGSLPEIQTQTNAAAVQNLLGYSQLYLEEEIRREGLVREVGPFAQFLELAAYESGKVVHLSNMSNETGIPVTTLRLYYQVLVDTFVGYWIYPYKGSPRKRLLSTPKFMLFDLGARNAAAQLPLNRDLVKLQGGELLEHWVGIELYHRLVYLGPGHRLYFWRTVSGAEVDFIVETPKEIIPIEVKWTTSPTIQDARHVKLFMATQSKARRGYIVCRVSEPRRLTPNITAIPWNML